MNFLRLSNDYQDPELRDLEIVERKGIGHPDTLADALAECVSMAYSRYCLEKFGVVLHHNVDKLYIGAGHFRTGFGLCEMVKPVQVRVNGRMSNSFAGEIIDLEEIQKEAVLSYLDAVLPHLKKENVVVEANATQHTRIPNWFSPRGVEDLPEAKNLKANDTSVCVSHWPMTTSEKLAYEIEKYFWEMIDGVSAPKFEHFGQDIKVMVCRQRENVDITVCLPVISTSVFSIEDHNQLVSLAESKLNALAETIIQSTECVVSIRVNPYQHYMLGTGSCIECGEEGTVGRGNSNNGVISISRPHSVEAWAGKNPVYHTGRVLSFLTMNLAKAINTELGVKCTVLAMTKNSHSLIPPYLLSIETNGLTPKDRVEEIVQRQFLDFDYLGTILRERQLK